ncbi:MAG: hypothetical protein WBV55_06790 [Candidatus Sulfotelmatobacter sp.]
MAKVTIRKGEMEFEINDLTFEQVKELVGLNGYGGHASKPATAAPIQAQPQLFPQRNDYEGLFRSISDRARLFLNTLRHHPDGIDSNTVAGKLGFQDARQLGGLTGAGITRIAKKYGVRMKDVYRAEITFPQGKRTVKFYPGKLVLAMNEEKPAV